MAKLVAAPSREILEAALTGLEAQREKLDEQILQVRSMLRNKKTEAFPHAAGVARKRVLSPEARKRIATAQKKRWAAFRKAR
jgi:hypothetical protein